MLVHFIDYFPDNLFKLNMQGIDWKEVYEEKKEQGKIIWANDRVLTIQGTQVLVACA